MKENTVQKSIVKLLVTLTSLLFTLIFALSSYAWVAFNRKLQTNGFEVLVNKSSDLGIYDIQIFKRFGADKAMDVSNEGEITLTEYDTVFTDKNVNTSIIMRLELGSLPYSGGKYQPFHLRVKCLGAENYIATQKESSESTLKEIEDAWVTSGAVLPNSYWTHDGKMSEVLSNIIGIRCDIGDATLNAYTDAEDIYSHAKDYLSDSTEQTFVSLAGTSKQGILTFNFQNYDALVNNGTIIVYIQVDYNDKLIETYSNQHDIITQTGEETGDMDELIKFTSDLTNCFIFLEG